MKFTTLFYVSFKYTMFNKTYIFMAPYCLHVMTHKQHRPTSTFLKYPPSPMAFRLGITTARHLDGINISGSVRRRSQSTQIIPLLWRFADDQYGDHASENQLFHQSWRQFLLVVPKE
jgi:hypothetical protein